MVVEKTGPFHRSISHVIARRVISVSPTAVSLLVLVSVAVVALSAAGLAFAAAPTFSSGNEVSAANRAEKEISPSPIQIIPLAWANFLCSATNFTLKGNVFRMNQLVIDPNFINARRDVDIVRVVPSRHSKIVPLTDNQFLVMSVATV